MKIKKFAPCVLNVGRPSTRIGDGFTMARIRAMAHSSTSVKSAT